MSVILAGAGIGLLLAAQIGPVTLLIVRAVLRGGDAVLVGLAMAAAVAAVDVAYAALGLAGLGSALDDGRLRLPLAVLTAAILALIGARTLWVGFRARLGFEADSEVATPRRAFATAIAATAFNPLTIALWTVSFPVAASQVGASSPAHDIELLAGVTIGTLGWYAGFAVVVALVSARIGPRLVPAVTIGTGVGLLGFAGVIGYRALHDD